MGGLCAPNRLGTFIQSNPIRLLLGFTSTLLILCVAIKSAKLDAELSSWIQRTSRIESELNYVSASIGDGQGASSQLILQSPRQQNADILTVDALMIHLEAMAIATQVTVDLHDVTWSLKDICFTPTLPDFDLHVTNILDRFMPCVIKTPLDCFWEGSKLLGPDQPVSQSTIGLFNAKWTSLSPLTMVQAAQEYYPHASFPYNSLIDWMRRVGITTGYQYKPCLDPADPNCPPTAPNKLSGKTPDIGLQLTGGCKGFAANQMHWKEEEIVGGLVKNKSGHIIRASGLQSTIQLMAEQDMYDYWRKTSKVQDINNWSAEKAKSVLDLWQQKFKDELNQFTRISKSSSSYKIYAMTSNSMLEPIDELSLLDFTNFHLCFALMIIFTCVAFPSFSYKVEKQSKENISSISSDSQSKESTLFNTNRIADTGVRPCNDKNVRLSFLKTTPIALVASIFIGLTFIASLGLDSFMNLPFNMATTQILPPLALYYGFNQFVTIANVYSRKLSNVPMEELTTKCLNELLPILLIESSSYTVAFLVATIIPVAATRVFSFQAIIYIQLATLVAIILMPTIMSAFLLYYTRPAAEQSTNSDETDISEDPIFTRIQNDLKNIQVTSIDFSAHLAFSESNSSLQLELPNIHSHNNKLSSDADKMDSYSTKSEFNNSEMSDYSSLPDDIDKHSFSSKIPTSEYDTESCRSSFSLNNQEVKQEHTLANNKSRYVKYNTNSLMSNRICQASVCVFTTFICVSILYHGRNVRYGLQLKDIVASESLEYETFLNQERNFPIYNVFAVTKGNFDYPNNQKLLYEYYKAIQKLQGIVRDEDSQSPKFWLLAFRDWLLEIQQKFDEDRKNKQISQDGWTAEASDAGKLAYKLLAQTGRADNPIDKRLVESNRLVSEEGIINPKAFYHYLTAWVMIDSFTYANTEANFRPEPKIWNDKPDDLKVEKARPLVYAQIPFLMKLPANQDSIRTISEFRSLSQAFELINLPNFPTGIPFIFWDQFLNLDLLTLAAVLSVVIINFLVFTIITTDAKIAAIILFPIFLTVLELYCLMGYLAISFNSILAVLLLSTIGIATIQSVHYATVSILERNFFSFLNK